jgi:hypothetical protein
MIYSNTSKNSINQEEKFVINNASGGKTAMGCCPLKPAVSANKSKSSNNLVRQI